jgi:hypothetical protein
MCTRVPHVCQGYPNVSTQRSTPCVPICTSCEPIPPRASTLRMRRIKGRGAGEWNGNRYLNSVNYCPSVSDPAHARQITGYLSKLER